MFLYLGTDASVDTRFEEQRPEWKHVCTGLPRSAAVVLLVGEDSVEEQRGHFSRLWSRRAWSEHQVAVDDLLSESSGSIPESSSGESSESSSASSESSSASSSTKVAPRPAPLKVVEVPADLEVDAFSDVSDDSDLFHVAVSEDYVPRIAADRDLQRILFLKQYLREYPLLPPDPSNPRLSFTDVHSGIRLPAVHCVIAGCVWSAPIPTGKHS